MKSAPKVTVTILVLLLSLAGLSCRHRQQVVVVYSQELKGVVLVGAQIEITGNIEFDTGAATIRDTPASQGVLNQVLQILQQNPGITRLRVEGHTDSDGTDASNLVLSDQRAIAVVGWLAQHGVAPARLSPVGCAAHDPLVPNTTPENKQRNRRTEFDIEEMNGASPNGYTSPCAPNPARQIASAIAAP
jgi:outer membrane protein OmpA-like peptidoglycan-associated protein